MTEPSIKADPETVRKRKEMAETFMKNGVNCTNVVKVVRCKDCKWYKANNGCPLAESGYFKNGKMIPMENDFCSYGERKTNKSNIHDNPELLEG